MPLPTHNITGTIDGASLGGEPGPLEIGTATFRPANSLEAVVDGSTVRLGAVVLDIKDLPDPLVITEGNWTITLATKALVDGRPAFRTVSRTISITADLTWPNFVAGAIDEPVITSTLVTQAEAAANEAEMWAAQTQALQDSAVSTLLATGGSLSRAQVDDVVGLYAETPGTEIRTALDKVFGFLVNVKDPQYGAVGDGVALDHLAIQAAIDAVAAAGGGVVYLPRGTYLVGATLNLKDRVFLRGDSPQATVIKLANGADVDVIKSENFDALTGTNAAVHPSFVGLFNLRVDGNDANNAAGVGVKLYARAVFIDNVIITHCSGDGLYTEGPASGAGVSEWSNLPPGRIGYLACIENGGNGWTHKGHSDMYVGYYQGIINTGHGLRMETVAGVTRSTLNADHLRISSNGVAVGSRGVYLTGSGTDLLCAVGRFENNGGAGIYADTNTKIRVGLTQLLQNCKSADAAQAILNGAHDSRLGKLVVRDPWLSTTDGVQVINSNGVEIDGGINGTTDPTGPAAGVASTGVGLKLQGGGTAGGLFDVRIRDYNGAGGSGLRTGDSAGIVGNRVRASILNCTTAWWCVNAGFGNLYDITATVAAGQSTVGGGAAGLPGVGGDARVFGNDGVAQVYP